MDTAVIRGSTPRVRDAESLLASVGFETRVLLNDDADLSVADRLHLAAGTVCCYLDLSNESAKSADEWTRSQLARLSALVDIGPLLTSNATVVLVVDEPSPAPGAGEAVRTLAEAALAEQGPPEVHVSVVEHPTPAALRALRRPTMERRSVEFLAEFGPTLRYADWRDQITCLSSVRDEMYLGWITGDHRAAVAVLRDGVLSPLRSAEGTAEAGWSWSQPGVGASRLARAILADVLGSTALCTACLESSDGCPVCRGTGLAPWALDLSDAFAKDIVVSLPADEFELAAASIRSWAARA